MDNTISSLVSQAASKPSVTTADVLGWFNANPNADLATINKTMQEAGLNRAQVAEAVGTNPNIAQQYLTQQILATSDPTQWSGQGYGSAQANAADMAKIIANTGASDISQFGQIQVPVKDEDGNVSYQTTYGNKTTNQPVANTYSERQTGNAFGGTFAGSGNTGYRVNFDAQGNPQFYTTGASSSNLKDYAPLLAIGGLALGMPYLSEMAGLGGTSLGSLGSLTAAEAAGLGLTSAEAAGLGLSAADFAAAGGAISGMGTGTGLTAAGAGGLGGASGVSSLGGSLGSGLTAAGAGGLGGATGAAGLGGLGTGVGAGVGGMAAANSLLGGSTLGSTLGSLATGVGAGALGSTLGGLSTGVGSALGAGAGSALGAGAGSALGTSLATGLGLSALGNVLGTAANQSGISDARSLINQYGTQAQGNLAKAYADAQGLNVANRSDLTSNYANTQRNLNDIYNQQVGFQQPYQAVGQTGSQGLIGNQDYFNRQFTNADLNANLAPNYAFQLQQGQMANQRAANMGGGSMGGNALQGLQRYTQDYAGNAYQNAFTNFQNQRQNIYNTLSGMANIGTTSGGQLASLGNTLGGNLGSLSSNYGGNITTNAGQGIGAANAYGLNTANLATGIGSALAGNAVAGGANTANALSTLGNTALLGSMIKAT